MTLDRKTEEFIKNFLRLYYNSRDLKELVDQYNYSMEDVCKGVKDLEEKGIVIITRSPDLTRDFLLTDKTFIYSDGCIVLVNHTNKDILFLQETILDEENIHLEPLHGENPKALKIEWLKESSRIQKMISNL